VEPAEQAIADPAAWLAEQPDEGSVVEVTLADAARHVLLLPSEVSPQTAVGILIGSRDDEDLPWPRGDWLETDTACWVRRSAIVSVRIVARSRTATA
jgi:hypothetical protein